MGVQGSYGVLSDVWLVHDPARASERQLANELVVSPRANER